jgi:hypothetical protein
MNKLARIATLMKVAVVDICKVSTGTETETTVSMGSSKAEVAGVRGRELKSSASSVYGLRHGCRDDNPPNVSSEYAGISSVGQKY